MKRTVATLFPACLSLAALAFDPLAVGPYDTPQTDDECLAGIVLYDSGASWRHGLNSLAKRLGNEKVGERLVEFMEPVFEAACGSSYPAKEYKLCWGGLQALGHLMATNSLPFLERAVMHGSERFRRTALSSYCEITEGGDDYLAFLDRMLDKGAITRRLYTVELGVHYWGIRSGERQTTLENRLKTATRLMNNPSIGFFAGPKTDGFFLADFPSYTNSVERLAALSTFLDNENTPPDVRAKYEPERDRLQALPPESLVRVTDELEARLAELKRAAERKRKIAQVKKVAVPAGVIILILGVLAVLFRRRRRFTGGIPQSPP